MQKEKVTSSITVTSTSGKSFPVTAEAIIVRTPMGYFVNCTISAFGVLVRVGKAQDYDVITISASNLGKSTIGEVFSQKPPKGKDVHIKISEEAAEAIEAHRQQTMAGFQQEKLVHELLLQQEAAAMPVALRYEYGVDMGDYKTTVYSRIIEVRELTQREKDNNLAAWSHNPELFTKLRKIVHVHCAVPERHELAQQLRQQQPAGVLMGGYELFAVTVAQSLELAKAQEAEDLLKQQAQAQQEAAASEQRVVEQEVLPAGTARCWECGCVHSIKKMEYVGGAGYYCGC